MASDPGHIPVLPDQVLTLLDPRPGQIVLDCTVGRGGHAALILPHLAPGGRYIGLDLDPANLAFVRQRLASPSPGSSPRDPGVSGVSGGSGGSGGPEGPGGPVRLDLIHANFISARSVLDGLGIRGADLLLADLGFASPQMEDPARGLSFTRDGPLDMRLDPTAATPDAADLVNRLPERDLADLIYRYGEERLSRRIARKITERRRESPITTTSELARIVRAAYGNQGRSQRIDPATRTFMALRIAVNAELEALEQLLSAVPLLLAPRGAAAVISFHSLEDRRVKQAFTQLYRDGRAQRLTPKPLLAAETEIQANPRSRSAKLRAIRLADPPPDAGP
jgi:16S rRNA (cytosine1402-N4)-methyltransferase